MAIRTRIAFIQVDCVDPERLATFWSEFLGLVVNERVGQYVCLSAQTEEGPQLCFQAVPETKTAKNRVHLDIVVADIEAEARRVKQLGGSEVGDGDVEEHGWRFRVMRDPEGNEFCLTSQ